METQVATKAEFAAMIRVSPGRVSQLIAEGKLGAAELQGEGRSAKIKVAEAMAALKLRLDMSQMAGNGSKTRLDQTPSPADHVDARFKMAKLEQQEAINRKIAEEEKARSGIYVLAVEARAEMAKVTAKMLQAFEGGLADMASAIAAQYQLPQRDVVHMMRSQFRDLRAKVSVTMQADGELAPPVIEVADTTH